MDDQELTHIDLFSGIGGFTLAGEWAGFRTVVFCEKEPFCQEVLKERFGAVIADPSSTKNDAKKKINRRRKQELNNGKEVWNKPSANSRTIPLIPDIRDFDGTKWRGTTLLTGGFPCQPFSVAGKQGGKKDDRYLWPEMFRVIKEAKPRWILAENVTGIVKLALGQVLSDLEGIGYDFPRDHEGTPIVPVIPACGLNAPHRRYRVWIIAHSGLFGQKKPEEQAAGTKQSNQDAPDSKGRNSREQETRDRGKGSGRGNQNASDPTSPGLQRFRGECELRESKGEMQIGRDYWNESWYEIATCLCRVDDGLPSWIHSDRVKRLKALGNAIVPQIAYEIMKRIAFIERNDSHRECFE